LKKEKYEQVFRDIKQRVKNDGLLERAPFRGSLEMIIILSAFILSLSLVGVINPFINALMMILVMIRSTYLSHDLTHNQYFSKSRDRKFSYFFGNVILGLSSNWWRYAHNLLHHIYTNIESKDADIQAIGGLFIGKKDWGSLFHKYQKYLYWLLLPFITASFLFQTLLFCVKHKRVVEAIFVLAHFSIPYYIWTSLDMNEAILFLTIMYGGYGLFLGLVVITNHYGCEVISDKEANEGISWIDLQTRTSRNIKGGFFIHFICGGLNTQIEHHLFPKAPRFYLLKVAKIVKEECKKNNIIYYQTTLWQAYKEIYETLDGKGYKTIERMKATK